MSVGTYSRVFCGKIPRKQSGYAKILMPPLSPDPRTDSGTSVGTFTGNTPDLSDSAAITAMLLAAGRGERMRPLTDSTPKPLLQVQGKSLLQRHLEALSQSKTTRVIINTAWLGEQIERAIGASFVPSASGGSNLKIHYSHEGLAFGRALETAGGIVRALPDLGPLFWVAAGDVFAPDFCFDPDAVVRFRASTQLAHLWLVPNPEHNPAGDFGLDAATGLARNTGPASGQPRYTYSTIGLFRRELFMPPWCNIPAGNPDGQSLKLAPLLRAAMDQELVSASLYTGAWTDVGTPERLALLNRTDNA